MVCVSLRKAILRLRLLATRTLLAGGAALLVVFGLFWGYVANLAAQNVGGPVVRVAEANWPAFDDDVALRGLAEALERQLQTRISGAVVLGETRYSANQLERSVERFLELARATAACLDRNRRPSARSACMRTFNRALRAEFVLYSTRQRARLTAYYTPTIDATIRREGEYRFPIYGLPQSPQLQHASRRDIDFGNVLAGHGLELFYARDLFDIYLMNIEGGGRIRVRDGSGGQAHYRYLSYAGDNGLRFHLLEEYMVRHGMLRDGDVSRFAQRRYLRAHPEQAEEVYSSCPGYVFFRETPEAPLASAGVPLTPGRSLALDPDYYPATGLIAYVTARVPQRPKPGTPLDSNPPGLRYREMRQFYVGQDTGPYIEGAARFDLYFGEDDDALFLANNLRADGTVYFLVLR